MYLQYKAQSAFEKLLLITLSCMLRSRMPEILGAFKFTGYIQTKVIHCK